jgi:hypothetical protein
MGNGQQMASIENTPPLDPLFVDRYVGDKLGNLKTLMDAGPPWHGFVHKLTQGTYHDESERAWQYRQAMLNHPRYGVDFWDGYYHFLDLNQDPVRQADYFWRSMLKIGGEKQGTIWAMLDVERGGQRMIPSARRVFDAVRAWAARYEVLSGWKPTLYGGELLRALGIHRAGAPIDLLGCGRNAIALYGARMTVGVIETTGTDPKHLLFWQYDGDGEAHLAGYPREAPGFGPTDISAMVLPGGLLTMRLALQAERRA